MEYKSENTSLIFGCQIYGWCNLGNWVDCRDKILKSWMY